MSNENSHKVKNESDVEYLLRELLCGFTVTDRGIEWLHSGSIREMSCEDFERSLSPYLSEQKAADLAVVYRSRRYG